MSKRKLGFSPLLGFVVIIVIMAGYYLGTESKKTVIDETTVIGQGSIYRVSINGQAGKEYAITVRVSNDKPIDVFILDSDNYDRFLSTMRSQSGSFSSLYTEKNTLGSEFDFTAPGPDTYYLLLNNAGNISGGARPSGDSSVYVKVTG